MTLHARDTLPSSWASRSRPTLCLMTVRCVLTLGFPSGASRSGCVGPQPGFGAWDCLAGGGLDEPAVVSGSGGDGGGTGPLDGVADAAADRRGDAPGGVHVGSGASVGSGSCRGEDGRRGCDDAGSERGDAEHRASGHGRIVRSVRAAAGGGVGDCDADAGGVGAIRPVAEEQEDVERGLAVTAGPGCEGREDEGRSDAPGPQGGARGGPGDGGDSWGDGAGCVGGGFGDVAGDADGGSRAGRGGTAGGSGRSRRWWPTKGTTATRPWRRSTKLEVRSYISEPERGPRRWQDKTPPAKRAAQQALYGNRRRTRGDRGRRLQRRRGELVERPFAHQYETGGLRRVWVRGHENVRKRVLIQAACCNLGLLLRRLTGVGHAPEPAGAGSFGDSGPDRPSDRPLGASGGRLGPEWRPAAFVTFIRPSPGCWGRRSRT